MTSSLDTPHPHVLRRAFTSRQGYTLVEVLMTAAVATMGFASIIHLQTKSLGAVREAHDLSQATATGEHFVEMVRAQTQQCPLTKGTDPCAFLPPDGEQIGAWAVYSPPASDGALFTVSPAVLSTGAGGTFDFGLASEYPDGLEQRYCIHYRTAWIVDQRLLRVDVRVLWPHPDTALDLFGACSLELVDTPSGLPTGVGTVTVSGAIGWGTY